MNKIPVLFLSIKILGKYTGCPVITANIFNDILQNSKPFLSLPFDFQLKSIVINNYNVTNQRTASAYHFRWQSLLPHLAREQPSHATAETLLFFYFNRQYIFLKIKWKENIYNNHNKNCNDYYNLNLGFLLSMAELFTCTVAEDEKVKDSGY